VANPARGNDEERDVALKDEGFPSAEVTRNVSASRSACRGVTAGVEGLGLSELWPVEGRSVSATQVRVMLVDDHEVVREGLRTLLSRQKGMTVVGEAATTKDAIDAAARTKPDVIVMDVRLPDGSGVEACRTIREARPETKVIMLTSYADDEALFASILAGAAGYLLKQTRGQAVIDAITSVAAGRSLLDPDVTGKVLERVRRGGEDQDPAFASLTDQERKVLEQLAEGKTNREIGEILFLSEKTVKNYVSRILDKLGLARRAEAAAYMAKRRPRY
jgi:two-component system, NarL family, response regulator DevR